MVNLSDVYEVSCGKEGKAVRIHDLHKYNATFLLTFSTTDDTNLPHRSITGEKQSKGRIRMATLYFG